MEPMIRTLERHAKTLQFVKKIALSLPDTEETDALYLAEPYPKALIDAIDIEILYSLSLHPVWLNSPIFAELIVTKLYLELGVDKDLLTRRFTHAVNRLTGSSLEVYEPDEELDQRFIRYITLKTLTGDAKVLASLKETLGEKFMEKMVAVAEGLVKPDEDADYFCFFDRLEELMVQAIEDISASLAADASYLRKVEFHHYFIENGYTAVSTQIDQPLAFAILVAIGIRKQADVAKLRVFLLQHYKGTAPEEAIQAALSQLTQCQLVFKANNVKTSKRQQYSLTSEGVAITRYEVSRKIVAGQQEPLVQLSRYNPAYQKAAGEWLDPANQHILMKKLNRMAESFAFCRS